jgi:hypothetical protein
MPMTPQIWKEKRRIEWNPDPVEDPEPRAIPDGEESEEVDSSFLEELAHECMKLRLFRTVGQGGTSPSERSGDRKSLPARSPIPVWCQQEHDW